MTRVYDTDGNATSFSAAEISSISEIWARVAEDFAPFNINVTTVEPPSFANGAAVRVAIGGNYSDWFGQSRGRRGLYRRLLQQRLERGLRL